MLSLVFYTTGLSDFSFHALRLSEKYDIFHHQADGNVHPPESPEWKASRVLLSKGLAGQILEGLSRERKFESIERGRDRHAGTIPDFLRREEVVALCGYWGNFSSSKNYAGPRV